MPEADSQLLTEEKRRDIESTPENRPKAVKLCGTALKRLGALSADHAASGKEILAKARELYPALFERIKDTPFLVFLSVRLRIA